MPVAPLHTPYRIPKKAMYFDGADDYVKLTKYVGDYADVTIEFLIKKLKSRSYYALMYMGYVGDSNVYGITYYSPDNLLVYSRRASGWHGVVSNTKFKDNIVYHIVIVVPSNNLASIFVNGKIDATSSEIVPFVESDTKETTICARTQTYDLELNCLLGLVRVYNRVLSEDEIRHNYYHLDDPVRDGLVLWLDWTSVDEANGVWRDKSGFGNDGVIYGAVPVDIIKG